MRRGGSSGGGQSSLGYLFGSGEVPVPNNAKGAQTQRQPVNNAKGAQTQCQPANNGKGAQTQCQPANGGASQSANVATSPKEKGIAAGIHGTLTNNYHRADGQNCGNFITDRPSTKVHAAPGGGSSLGYLFGDPPSRN